ncbi:helix-turn-helix domain-containing protein [Undibacterium sp. Ji50W]|uniref:helix-turn-helix domain-containing protein n=1 Tax=Undibacterium sp. Ji50W TaxID=3413041 RepID=UPI003BF3B00C
MNRPACYPHPPAALLNSAGNHDLPLLDVLTSPVPTGLFNSPVDARHVLCLHLGDPVPVSYGAGRYERQGVRLHGQFCVVPGGSSTRWTLTQPATSLLLRLSPHTVSDTAAAMNLGRQNNLLAPAIHIRDPQIERIGWMMQAEDHDAYPGGRIFADSLAVALAARLFALQSRKPATDPVAGRSLPAWRLRHVIDYVEAHLDSDLTLAELAAVAGFSLSHFKSLFRQATGMPVHRYVMERRLQRARQLMMEGKQSMTDIAMETGFAHPSHLAGSMRRVLGFSPAQIRGMMTSSI